MADKENVAANLKEAYESVTAAGLPEHLQAEALRLAFDAVTNSSARTSPRKKTKGKTPKRIESDPETDDTPVISEDAFFEQLSDGSEVPEATLRDVYFLDGKGKVGLNLRGQDLGNSMKARVISITTLLAGAYRLGMGTNVTAGAARDVAKTFQSLDRNFATRVRDNPNVSYTGPNRTKVIDLRAGAEEAYRDFVLAVVN